MSCSLDAIRDAPGIVDRERLEPLQRAIAISGLGTPEPDGQVEKVLDYCHLGPPTTSARRPAPPINRPLGPSTPRLRATLMSCCSRPPGQHRRVDHHYDL